MDKIEFFSTVNGLVEACPIYPAKDYRATWMSAAREDYIKVKQGRNDRIEHLYQCPGIFDTFNQGYIVPLWHDVIIKTKGDNRGFAWVTPTNDLPELVGHNVVGTHKPGIDKFIPKRPGTLSAVVKFNTPWHVIAPKGVKFLMMPVAYPDTFEFESTVGVLDPSVSSEINVQVNWNILEGDTLLKAGTPLCHLLPISERQFDLVCRDVTEHDKKWLEKRKFLNNFTFKPKRNLIKELYYKHFAR